jgi:hypothetical protein
MLTGLYPGRENHRSALTSSRKSTMGLLLNIYALADNDV